MLAETIKAVKKEVFLKNLNNYGCVLSNVLLSVIVDLHV